MDIGPRILVRNLYLWACRRLYNELAWGYDLTAWGISGGQWSAWQRLALDCLPAQGRVLEVGFGTGGLLAELAGSRSWGTGQGLQVWGLEASSAMHRVAAAKLARRGLAGQVPRIRGLAQKLPFPDGYFDALVATFPADYITTEETAREFARVLRAPGSDGRRPGGRLVVGGLAVAIENPRLARLVPVFYGLPQAAALERWRARLQAAGLEPRLVAQPARGVQVVTLVADRVA